MPKNLGRYINEKDVPRKEDIPDKLADLTDDATHRTVTDTEKIAWNAKFDGSASVIASGESMFILESGTDTAVGIQITPMDVSQIEYGGTIQFSASYVPADSSVEPIVWESSNSGVVTITSGGLATGTGRGTCVITASGANVSASITLSCEAPLESTSIIDWNLTAFDGALTNGETIANLRGISAYDGTLSLPVTGDAATGTSTELTLKSNATITTSYSLEKNKRWSFRVVCGEITRNTSHSKQRIGMGSTTGYPSIYYSESSSAIVACLCGSSSKSELVVPPNSNYTAGLTAVILNGLSIATYHDYVYVCNGENLSLYVDGSLAAQQSLYLFAGGTTIGLGDITNSRESASYVKCKKFQVYNYALSASEVLELYNNN